MNIQSSKLPGLTVQTFLRYALCLLLLVAPFARGLYYEAYFLPFIIAASILFLICLIDQYKHRDSGFFIAPLDWALLALLVAYLLSQFTAVNSRAALSGLMKYVVCFMVFWMCSWTSRREKGYAWLCFTAFIAGAGMAVVGILIFIGLINYPYALADGRVSGTLEYANTFGIYMAMASLIGWSLVMARRQLPVRALVSGSNALVIMAMLGSLSRGTWLVYPFAVLAFVLLVGRGKRLEAGVLWLVSFGPGLIMGRSLMGNPHPSAVIYLILAFILAAALQLGWDYTLKNRAEKIQLSKRSLRIGLVALALIVICVSILSISKLSGSLTGGSLSRLTNITLQDENVQLRFEFNRNAIKIVKDHPLTGIGPGGWADLYHHYASSLYWSDKAHNYFLQTWVESGTLGLIALLAVWVSLVYLLWKYWNKSRDEKDNPDHALFWGGATAVFLLGAHSFIDFDMSYPAVALLLFGLIGLLKGMAVGPAIRWEDGLKRRKKNRQSQEDPLSGLRSQDLAVFSVGVLASFILCITAISFMTASAKFKTGQEIINQDPNGAVVYMSSALKLDSLNATYWVEYARYMAFVAAASQNQAAYNQALASGEKAYSLQPYNMDTLNALNSIYSYLGSYDKGLKLAEAMIWSNPMDPAGYENLASTEVLAGIYQLEGDQLQKARSYWQDALNVVNQVPPGLASPAVGLNYTSGQANLLLGNTELGEQQLATMLTVSANPNKGTILPERSTQVDTVRTQARIWLAASLQISGKQTEAQQMLEQIPSADRESAQNTLEKAKTWLNKARS